jgi:hypothetical protein
MVRNLSVEYSFTPAPPLGKNGASVVLLTVAELIVACEEPKNMVLSAL